MAGVSRRVGDLQAAAAEPQPLAAVERAHGPLRHGQNRPPERVHAIAVQPPGAREQAGRIHQVGRAVPVDVHAQVRVAAHEHADPAGVVEVDVGEQHAGDGGERVARQAQALFERSQRRGRSGIDEQQLAAGLEQIAGDVLGVSLEVQVDEPCAGGEATHGGPRINRADGHGSVRAVPSS